MADDGLEYSTDMTDLTSKANRKMLLVGNSTQLTNLVTTYPGQKVFSTTTGGNFLVDNYYKRDSTNTVWNNHIIGVEGEEQSTTPVGSASESAFFGYRWYFYFTMPSTWKLNIITKMDWYNGATVAGSVLCGALLMTSNPPLGTDKCPLLGITREVAMSGANSIQSSTMVSCNPIRAGAIVGAWFSNSDNTATFKYTNSGDSQNFDSGETYSSSPVSGNTATFNATVSRIYLKVYYRGLF